MSISQIGIYGGVSRLSQNKSPAIPSSWWLSGGINAANCVAAYQPKGAASYAASKVNLANPGTYNAEDGTAYPTWDATNGWIFNSALSQRLNTGIVPSDTYTLIIRFSNASTGFLAGRGDSSTNDRFGIRKVSIIRFYVGSGYVDSISTPSYGVAAINTDNAYIDKTKIAINGAITGNLQTRIQVGTYEYTNNTFGFYYSGNVQSIAIYNITLNDNSINQLTDAMNAL